MADIPEDDLEETRAALAPTLEATAAILPWLAKPRPPRFDSQLNQRWIEACQRLNYAWSNRYGDGSDDFRPAIFALYGVALETADGDCLELGEALASAAGQLEDSPPTPRLLAALSAAVESLNEAGGLEHEAFAERARHFSRRLETTASERSSVLDNLFAVDAQERIGLMREALAALPPDAYALKCEADHVAEQAEHLDLFGIMHLARQLASNVAGEPDLDNDAARRRIEAVLGQLANAVTTVKA